MLKAHLSSSASSHGNKNSQYHRISLVELVLHTLFIGFFYHRWPLILKLAITSGWIGPGAKPIMISFASPTRPIIPELLCRSFRRGEEMTNKSMPGRYSRVQAWAHDTLIANRALNLHDYILEYGNLLEILAETRDRSLLDVGCGGGQAAIRMKERYPHLRLTGIDTSEAMIAGARYRARIKGCAIQFEVADAEALLFPGSSLEVVYSFGSAKHCPNPLKGFGECWRVLKPGGELLIADAT